MVLHVLQIRGRQHKLDDIWYLLKIQYPPCIIKTTSVIPPEDHTHTHPHPPTHTQCFCMHAPLLTATAINLLQWLICILAELRNLGKNVMFPSPESIRRIIWRICKIKMSQLTAAEEGARSTSCCTRLSQMSSGMCCVSMVTVWGPVPRNAPLFPSCESASDDRSRS